MALFRHLWQARTDRQLLEKYRQTGRQEYLAELFQRYLHLIYTVALRYVQVKEDAEDIAMKVYEIMLSKLPPEVDNPGGWLHTVTRNESLMLLRSRKKEKQISLFENMEYADEEHHNHKIVLEDNLRKLEECIRQLKKEQRQCVELFYKQQKCYKEVANLTGFELKQVKSHIQNGKRNLQNCMAS